MHRFLCEGLYLCAPDEYSQETVIGYTPKRDSLDVSDLDLSESSLDQLFMIDAAEWKQEVTRNRAYMKQLGSRLPKEIDRQLDDMARRLDQQHHF